MGVSRYYLQDHKSLLRWTKYQLDKYSSSIVGLLSPKQNELILDDGAGNGRLSIAMAKEGAEVISLDINKRLLRTAAENLEEKELRNKTQLVLADIQNLPFKGNTFDKILCVHNLWYVANYGKATSEMFRALKNGGTVIIDHLNLLNWSTYIGELIYVVKKIFRRNSLPIFYRTPQQIVRPFRAYQTEIFFISFGSKKTSTFGIGTNLWAPRFIVKSSKSHRAPTCSA